MVGNESVAEVCMGKGERGGRNGRRTREEGEVRRGKGGRDKGQKAKRARGQEGKRARGQEGKRAKGQKGKGMFEEAWGCLWGWERGR